MADPNEEAGDARDDTENDGDEHEVERLLRREDGATVLRRLADGVANGSVVLGEDEAITVAVPERFELELEYERDDEEAELEVELEWPVADGDAAEGDAPGHEETDATETRAEPEAEEESEADGDAPSTAADESAADAAVAELVGSGDATRNARFELYRDRADEWRWRLVHDNGNIIADSGEGYDRKAGARQGLESVMRNAPGAAVVTLED